MAGPTAFVGRESELATLLGALASDFRLVLVAGDAGVGKTQFLETGIARAGAAGMVLLRGECLPLAHTLPLLPVAEALGELGKLDDGGLLAAALDDTPATSTSRKSLASAPSSVASSLSRPTKAVGPAMCLAHQVLLTWSIPSRRRGSSRRRAFRPETAAPRGPAPSYPPAASGLKTAGRNLKTGRAGSWAITRFGRLGRGGILETAPGHAAMRSAGNTGGAAPSRRVQVVSRPGYDPGLTWPAAMGRCRCPPAGFVRRGSPAAHGGG